MAKKTRTHWVRRTQYHEIEIGKSDSEHKGNRRNMKREGWFASEGASNP